MVELPNLTQGSLGGDSLEQELSTADKAVLVLSDREKLGLSTISKDERFLIFRARAINRLYFNNDEDLDAILKDYLELSLSVQGQVSGTGRQSIVDLFKQEISALANSLMGLMPGGPMR